MSADVQGWEMLSDQQIKNLPLPTDASYGLMRSGGLIAVGQLLAQGPGSHWLMWPLAGYPQYLEGSPAQGGIIPEHLTPTKGTFRKFQNLDMRLAATTALLAQQKQPDETSRMGRRMAFLACTGHCQGYKVRTLLVRNPEVLVRFQKQGYIFLDDTLAKNLIEFLNPGEGICRT